jgi:uncharacterized membrane protein
MRIVPFIGPAVIGLVVSFVITMLAWNIQIEHQAYKCTDDVGFGFFWESMSTHEGAGDTALPGWTWGKIRAVQALYEAGFVLLWFAIAAAPALALKKESRAQAS